MRPTFVWLATMLALVTAACGGSTNKSPSVAQKPTAVVAAPADGADVGALGGDPAGFASDGWGGAQVDAGESIPVTSGDPTWGSPTAPVTIVEFADLQCPFCAKAEVTMNELRRAYGPQKLRIVWKHDPLPMHEHARQAADLGAGIFALGGSAAFFTYVDTLYAGFMDRSRDTPFPTIAVGSATAAAEKFPQRIQGRALMDAADGPGSRKVDDDLALAEKLGVTGTPAFFVNGILVSGAQPVDAFKKHIDDELTATQASAAAGTPSSRVYAERLAANVKAGRAKRPGSDERVARKPEAPDTTVWKVPVGTSPVRGKPGALVTLVAFSDFQCPFCRKADKTLDELRAKYGDKLRVVYKHNPLPFHEHAAPASELAIEAYKKKGNDAFWKVHDALFASDAQHLGDQDLEEIGKTVGLDPKSVAAAIDKKKHADVIQADQDLAEDLDANGTPAFFINGRRLTGAQPVEKFSELIDAQLAVAEAKVRAGTPATGVYDAIMKDAQGAAAPETKTAPKPTADNPSRGNGQVTLQIFSDFQCPFCKRVEPTLADLEKAFPGKLRIVWHNRPLPMHENAEAAAEAALEARKQKGDAGFWQFHDLLFADQQGLDRKGLEEKAGQAGLDLSQFRAALDRGTHRAAVEADAKIADDLGINGTPGVLVDDIFISGAESLPKFKRAVRLALEKKGKKTK